MSERITELLRSLPQGVASSLAMASALYHSAGSARDLPWDQAHRWLAGGLSEFSGHSGLYRVAFDLVARVQADGGLVGWVSMVPWWFYPKDVEAMGVELGALPVVRAHGDHSGGFRAAGHMLGSGAFKMVVLDLPGGAVLPLPAASTLAGHARHLGAVVLCLTRKQAHEPSLGSMVSLRGQVGARVVAGGGGPAMEVAVEVLKDKRHGPGRVYRLPPVDIVGGCH